jgi:hypothetical protein
MVSADAMRLQQVFSNLFSNAVRYSPDDQAWLRLYGHTLIDSLSEPDGGSTAMVLEILGLMRENLLGDGSWGSLIWDHDLVPKVIEATGLSGEAKEQLELVASWDGVCSYVCETLDGSTAQERALDVVERIQEVVRLAVEFELVDLE